MKICIIVDKPNSAIYRLALPIAEHNPHLKMSIVSFHPKRPAIEEIHAVQKELKEADIIHISYWKSGEKIREMFPHLLKDQPTILWHHNPYDVDKKTWNEEYDEVVVHNRMIHSKIPYAHLIYQGIDLDLWKYKEKGKDSKVVLMVVARIEGKKGIKEVAQACKELGYRFHLVGRISKMGYFKEIEKIGVDFHENITDEELRDWYYKSDVLVCNSIDDFESGPLPVLEAMACGTPVLTRNVGQIPDIYDGKNMVVRKGDPDNLVDLADELKNLMESPEQRRRIREKAWQSIKTRSDRKMAWEFCNLYYQVIRKKEKESKGWVSIIIPTFDRPEALSKCLFAAATQDYPTKEIIVVDSGNKSAEPIITELRKHTEAPVKYIRFDNKGDYTLAKARNIGVVEAQGEFLVFCDDRIIMEEDAVKCFAQNRAKRTWLWGVKDGVLKGFVENFSCIDREELILRGAFNERVDCYGGMSQEIRTRMERGGIDFKYIKTAKASTSCKSGARFKKKDEIIRAKFMLFKLYGG